MSATRWLHLRRLGQQPLRTAVALVAVAAGVALLSGVLMAWMSLNRSVSELASDLSGDAALRVEGPVDHGGLPEAVLADISTAPGVARAVPLVTARAAAVDATGQERYVMALGVDCSVEALVGDFSCDPATFATAPALVSARLAAELGEGGVLRTDGGPVSVRSALAIPALDEVNSGAIAVWPLAEAQARFTRIGRLDVVLVVPEAGADLTELRSAVARAAGPSAVIRGPGEATGLGFIDLIFIGLALASLLGLTIGIQLVRNTLLLSFEERRTELALYGAVGATPGRVARGLLSEAAVLGATGGLLGATLGIGIAGAFVTSLSEQAARTTGLRLDLHVSPVAVAIGAGFGLVAAALAAIEPARRAARLEPAAELAGRPPPTDLAGRSPRVTALLALGAAVGLALGVAGRSGGSIETWQPPAAVAGLGLAASCAFRLPGRVAPGTIGLLKRRSAGRTGTARLALGNLAGDPARTIAIATALAVAVAIAVTLDALAPSIAATGRQHAELAGEVVTVSAVPLNNATGLNAKLTDEELAVLDRVEGVAARHGRFSAAVSHPSLGDVFVTSTDGPPPRYHVHLGDEPVTVLGRGEVLIGPALARTEGLRPGDRFTFPAVAGLEELVVGAVWGSPDGVGRSVWMPLPTFEALFGTRPPTSVTVVPSEGVTPEELAERVRSAGFGPHVTAYTPAELSDEFAAEYSSFVGPFRTLQYGLLVVAFTATASTLLLAAVQRRREHALLAAIGLTPRGLGAMTVAESLILAAIAVVTGAAAGLVGARAFSSASGVLTGATFDVPLTLAPLPAIAAAVTTVAVAAGLLPALRTARIDPAPALRDE